jgi:LysM repeat protein
MTHMQYQVQAGDTLSNIARSHNLSLQALLDANPDLKANPNMVRWVKH